MTTTLKITLMVLAVAALACGGTIKIPDVPTAGPTKVDEINVPAPTSGETRLTLSFGAGELKLTPGAANLVEGTASYNLDDLKPQVITDGSSVEIKQEDLLRLVEPSGVKSVWDFKLGSSPMDLSINAGAYEGDFELGGLSLTGLTVKDGAASVDLSFSKPNPVAMTVLRYETGASQVELTGLANANFSTMLMSSGAGDYALDFTGDLKRDATITITTGLSNIELVIPRGIPATLTADTELTNVNVGSSWKMDGNRYTQTGTGPTLTFIIKGGAGNLTLSD